MLTITRLESSEGLARLEPEWNSLLAQCPNRNIFLTYEWISNWWKHCGQGKRLYILLAKEEGRLIGIAPLMISKSIILGIPVSKLEFVGMPLSDYSDFIIMDQEEIVLQSFYSYLMEKRHDWDFINLNRILESSTTLGQSKGFLKSRPLCNIYLSDTAPSILIEGNNSDLIKSISDRSSKRNIKLFRENKGGEMESCVETGLDPVGLIHKVVQLHKRRWNDTPTPSIFNDSSYCRFLEAVIPDLMKKGHADIFYLTSEGRLVAFLLVFIYDNVYLQYMIVHDISIPQYAPGIVLLIKSLEYNLKKKYREYDFLRGGEKYKLKYANKIKKLYKISIHKNPLLYLLDYVSSSLEIRIKQDDRLHKFFAKFEKWLRVF